MKKILFLLFSSVYFVFVFIALLFVCYVISFIILFNNGALAVGFYSVLISIAIGLIIALLGIIFSYISFKKSVIFAGFVVLIMLFSFFIFKNNYYLKNINYKVATLTSDYYNIWMIMQKAKEGENTKKYNNFTKIKNIEYYNKKILPFKKKPPFIILTKNTDKDNSEKKIWAEVLWYNNKNIVVLKNKNDIGTLNHEITHYNQNYMSKEEKEQENKLVIMMKKYYYNFIKNEHYLSDTETNLFLKTKNIMLYYKKDLRWVEFLPHIVEDSEKYYNLKNWKLYLKKNLQISEDAKNILILAKNILNKYYLK